MSGYLKRVIADRARGQRPGAPRALGAAALTGGAVSVITYRLLRSRG